MISTRFIFFLLANVTEEFSDKAIEMIAQWLTSSDIKLLRGSTTTIANITMNITTKEAFTKLRDLGVVQSLINIIKSSALADDIQIQKAAILALSRLTDSHRNQETLLQTSG